MEHEQDRLSGSLLLTSTTRSRWRIQRNLNVGWKGAKDRYLQRLAPSYGGRTVVSRANIRWLTSNLAPLTLPTYWTGLAFATWAARARGIAAAVAAELTGNDARFSTEAQQQNAAFVVELTRALVAHTHKPDRGTAPEAHDLPPGTFSGSRVLILTVTDSEHEAVEALLGPQTDASGTGPPTPWLSEHDFVRGVKFFHATVRKGPQASLLIRHALTTVQPKYVVMVGICAGLDKDNQKLGDVVAAKYLRDLAQGEDCRRA